jgi:hypothetical protein
MRVDDEASNVVQRLLCHSIRYDSECVSMTWRAMSGGP